MAEVKEVKRHVVLHGAEEFQYGGSIGMPVSRTSGTPFVVMAAVYANSRIVTTKKSNEARDLGAMLEKKTLSISLLPRCFLIMELPAAASFAGSSINELRFQYTYWSSTRADL